MIKEREKERKLNEIEKENDREEKKDRICPKKVRKMKTKR